MQNSVTRAGVWECVSLCVMCVCAGDFGHTVHAVEKLWNHHEKRLQILLHFFPKAKFYVRRKQMNECMNEWMPNWQMSVSSWVSEWVSEYHSEYPSE